MVARRIDHADDDSAPRRRRPPARTPEAREKQLIAKAYDLAEKQIDEGTASSQVITHFLKMGTEETKLQREKLRKENLLTEAKIADIQSGARIEELYANAIAALRGYQGQDLSNDESGQ